MNKKQPKLSQTIAYKNNITKTKKRMKKYVKNHFSRE